MATAKPLPRPAAGWITPKNASVKATLPAAPKTDDAVERANYAASLAIGPNRRKLPPTDPFANATYIETTVREVQKKLGKTSLFEGAGETNITIDWASRTLLPLLPDFVKNALQSSDDTLVHRATAALNAAAYQIRGRDHLVRANEDAKVDSTLSRPSGQDKIVVRTDRFTPTTASQPSQDGEDNAQQAPPPPVIDKLSPVVKHIVEEKQQRQGPPLAPRGDPIDPTKLPAVQDSSVAREAATLSMDEVFGVTHTNAAMEAAATTVADAIATPPPLAAVPTKEQEEEEDEEAKQKKKAAEEEEEELARQERIRKAEAARPPSQQWHSKSPSLLPDPPKKPHVVTPDVQDKPATVVADDAKKAPTIAEEEEEEEQEQESTPANNEPVAQKSPEAKADDAEMADAAPEVEAEEQVVEEEEQEQEDEEQEEEEVIDNSKITVIDPKSINDGRRTPPHESDDEEDLKAPVEDVGRENPERDALEEGLPEEDEEDDEDKAYFAAADAQAEEDAKNEASEEEEEDEEEEEEEIDTSRVAVIEKSKRHARVAATAMVKIMEKQLQEQGADDEEDDDDYEEAADEEEDDDEEEISAKSVSQNGDAEEEEEEPEAEETEVSEELAPPPPPPKKAAPPPPTTVTKKAAAVSKKQPVPPPIDEEPELKKAKKVASTESEKLKEAAKEVFGDKITKVAEKADAEARTEPKTKKRKEVEQEDEEPSAPPPVIKKLQNGKSHAEESNSKKKKKVEEPATKTTATKPAPLDVSVARRDLRAALGLYVQHELCPAGTKSRLVTIAAKPADELSEEDLADRLAYWSCFYRDRDLARRATKSNTLYKMAHVVTEHVKQNRPEFLSLCEMLTVAMHPDSKLSMEPIADMTSEKVIEAMRLQGMLESPLPGRGPSVFVMELSGPDPLVPSRTTWSTSVFVNKSHGELISAVYFAAHVIESAKNSLATYLESKGFGRDAKESSLAGAYLKSSSAESFTGAWLQTHAELSRFLSSRGISMPL